MTICYFGDYDSNYARNRVLLKGLKMNGVEILECVSAGSGLKKYWELFKKHHAIKNQYDILIVGQSMKSRLVWLAKLLSRKKIVWDAFYSFYDKYVYDSKLIAANSIKGRYYWIQEYLACKMADVILLDTNEHIKYFITEFNAPESKFIRVLVGTDIEPDIQKNIAPQHTNKLEYVGMSRISEVPLTEEDGAIFLVHFHGKYIPLQGVHYIIKAAKLLEAHSDIKFNLIGSGQTYKSDMALAEELDIQNINFIGRVTFEKLTELMRQADLCLGIFGNTPKSYRVIPNKVYEAVALKKPIITAKTPAIQELFIDHQDMLLCQSASARDLADKILELKNNPALAESLAKSAYFKFKKYATPQIIAKDLIDKLS
ncbi:MAG: hypothetical protein A2174_02360 [Candidatus Portnoybacteria bacterium RBG_13_41_18]|uniref:Glycosyl transferase family 1 domain-containing protein n=1 Tax=Candidatus Portnoybacteria bacterium RBG_13_41_18 TaxID=1801991 RepID=A0A1G2F9L2_9BACT|nr:MAG: hypothetical protein A2174_02360 [Candidatus Portnoybacteria bacterium RBG_13_41_18]